MVRVISEPIHLYTVGTGVLALYEGRFILLKDPETDWEGFWGRPESVCLVGVK
jgi:hypothetical protein